MPLEKVGWKKQKHPLKIILIHQKIKIMKRRSYRKTKRPTGRKRKSYSFKKKRGFKPARTYKPSRGGIRL